MILLRNTYILALICFANTVFCQENQQPIVKSNKIEIIDGQKFYMHTVEIGQTIYSIAAAYGLNQKDILFENPEAVDGIKPSQVLKIIYKTASVKVKSVQAENSLSNFKATDFILHTVSKQETLYSLSKLYKVSISEINQLNPELSLGLKEGQIVKIPKLLIDNTSAVVSDTNSTKALNESDKKSNFAANSENIKVSLLLPFQIEEIDTAKFRKNLKSSIPYKAYPAIEFYEGFLLAADSVIKSGASIRLSVMDAGNDSLKTLKLLTNPEIATADIIVGPFHNVPAKLVASYASKKRIPNVIPYAQQNKLLLGNQAAVKMCASALTQTQAIADYIKTTYTNRNVIALHNSLSKEKILADEFISRFNSKNASDSLRQFVYKSGGAKGLISRLSKSKDNIIFVPSNDQAFVTSLLNSIRTIKSEYSIIVFGMESWSNFDNIDATILEDIHLHLPSSAFINYSGLATQKMIGDYRKRFKTDPSKYAFQGYDCGLYFLTALSINRENMTAALSENYYEGLQNRFKFVQTGQESGYENTSVFILEYKDLTINLVK